MEVEDPKTIEPAPLKTEPTQDQLSRRKSSLNMSELLDSAPNKQTGVEAMQHQVDVATIPTVDPVSSSNLGASTPSHSLLPDPAYEAADTLTSLATSNSGNITSGIRTEITDQTSGLPGVKTEITQDDNAISSRALNEEVSGASFHNELIKQELLSKAGADQDMDEAVDQKSATNKAKSTSKKGVARKPAPKKRKVDNKSGSPAPSVQSNASLTKKSKGKAGGLQSKGTSARATPLLNSSPAPGRGSDDEDEEEGDDSDSGSDKVYCICRKKDDHSWMIACDGGCEDWYHGKCVEVQERDGDLLDKYICPNCTATGDLVTTWKPMCRRDGCRKPARLSKSQISKYCSDDCGVRFMQAMTRRTADATASPRKSKKRKVAHPVETVEGSSDEDDVGVLGDALRTSQVTSLAFAVDKATEFRNLGNQAVTSTTPASGTEEFAEAALQEAERNRLQEIGEEKIRLRDRMGLLKDREKFIATAKEQVNRYAEQENIKPRDVCGFDARLSWSEEQFARWRANPSDPAAVGTTPLPIADPSLQPLENHEAENRTNGDAVKSSGEEGGLPYFCAKKRCDKHRQWQKITLQDVRYDETELADRMRGLDREEGSIRERAILRGVREKAAGNTAARMVEVEVVMS